MQRASMFYYNEFPSGYDNNPVLRKEAELEEIVKSTKNEINKNHHVTCVEVHTFPGFYSTVMFRLDFFSLKNDLYSLLDNLFSRANTPKIVLPGSDFNVVNHALKKYGKKLKWNFMEFISLKYAISGRDVIDI